MKLAEPPTAAVYTLFLSSSNEDETRKLRQRVKRLVEDVINPRLNEFSEAGVRLALDMWERDAAQRVEPGQFVNDLFVAKARKAHLTLVLLLDEIRPGTREELEAALAAVGVQVAVLMFDRPGGSEQEKIDARNDYIRRHQHKILYNDRCGHPDSDDAWIALTQTLFHFTLSAIYRRTRETLTEVR